MAVCRSPVIRKGIQPQIDHMVQGKVLGKGHFRLKKQPMRFYAVSREIGFEPSPRLVIVHVPKQQPRMRERDQNVGPQRNRLLGNLRQLIEAC